VVLTATVENQNPIQNPLFESEPPAETNLCGRFSFSRGSLRNTCAGANEREKRETELREADKAQMQEWRDLWDSEI